MLREKSNSELIKILNERKKKFNSYKADYNVKDDEAKLTIDKASEIVPVKDEVSKEDIKVVKDINTNLEETSKKKNVEDHLANYKEAVFVKKNEDIIAENNAKKSISTQNEVSTLDKKDDVLTKDKDVVKSETAAGRVDKKKAVNNNVIGEKAATKTYNERMKQGFFKRKRTR